MVPYFQPVGEPRVVRKALPKVHPIGPIDILVDAVGVEATIKNLRRVKGVDPVGRARGYGLHKHIRQPVHAILVHHTEMAGAAAHHVVRVAVIHHRLEVRRVDVVVADDAVRIKGIRRAVRRLHGARAGGYIPELRVRQTEVVAQFMADRAGRAVQQTIGATAEAHLRQRIEQHVIFPVILVKIAHRGRHHACIRPDRGHILPVVIGPLRQANRRRDRRFPMHRAVGAFEVILVVGLQRRLRLLEGLRHSRVVRVEHGHVEQLLDALGLAARHRRQVVHVARRRGESRASGTRGRQVLVHGLELLVEGDGMGNLAERIVASLELDERPAVLHVHRLLGNAAGRFLLDLEFAGCGQVEHFVRGHNTTNIGAGHEVTHRLRLLSLRSEGIGGDLRRLCDGDAVQEDAILRRFMHAPAVRENLVGRVIDGRDVLRGRHFRFAAGNGRGVKHLKICGPADRLLHPAGDLGRQLFAHTIGQRLRQRGFGVGLDQVLHHGEPCVGEADAFLDLGRPLFRSHSHSQGFSPAIEGLKS